MTCHCEINNKPFSCRALDGIIRRYQDIGVDNLERAAFNRQIIKDKLYTIGYILVEKAIAHTPLKQVLPLWIPSGNLPIVGKKDYKEYGGGRAGFFEEAVVGVDNG